VSADIFADSPVASIDSRNFTLALAGTPNERPPFGLFSARPIADTEACRSKPVLVS